jgi:signal transduction histidine kinase/CheY-like chemotaxis protein
MSPRGATPSWAQRLSIPSPDEPQRRVFAITIWLAFALSCVGLTAACLAHLWVMALLDVVNVAVCARTLRRLDDPARNVVPLLWVFTLTLSLSSLCTTPTDPTILCYLFVLPLLSANLLDAAQTRRWFFRVVLAGIAALAASRLGWSLPQSVEGPFLKEATNFAGACLATRALLEALARKSTLSEKCLREAERAKTAFFANLGHEIRTPMNGVIGMTDALLLHPLPAEEREMVQTIRASGAVMLALVDDLLDYSKLEAGRLVLREAPTSLRALSAELRALWLPAATRKRLALELSLDPALPPLLRLDGLRLRQILDNLVSNALKFTEAGAVTVRLTREGQLLRCAVLDTGIGISSAQQERLFARFVQADDATGRHYQGAGLGLVLSRELARLMGGSLEVRSSPGQGSCFTCTLPLLAAEQPAAAGPAPSVVPPGLHVLVVDDNAVNRLVAQRLLERCGCQVASSVDGQAALDALELRQDFDLVLMDVHMPGLDGLETTRRLRTRHGQALRIVGCSASAESTDLERCRDAGMNDFLAKPVTHARLVELILRRPEDPTSFAPGPGA